MKFKLSNYVMVSDSIGPADELTSKRMLFSTRKGMGITVTNYLLNILEAGQFESIPDHMFNILMYHEIIVPADENEFEEIVQRKTAAALDARLNEITIAITPDTNWNAGIVDRINNRIAASLSSSENKTRNFQLHLDIAAGNFTDLSALYRKANNFFRDRKFPVKVKMDCTLQWPYKGDSDIEPIHEDIITITQIRLSVDTSHNGVTPQYLQHVNGVLQRLQEGDFKTHVTLILNSRGLQVLYALKDTLGAFVKSRKNRIEIRLADHYEDDNFAAKEQALLKYLSQMQLHLDFFPPVDSTYFTRTGPLDETKVYYDEPIINQLTKQRSKCADCAYLPMCGGKLHKHENGNDDCPQFIHNFMDKARLKYAHVI